MNRTRTAVAAVVLLCTALAGCTSSSSDDKPDTTPAPATSTPTLTAEQATQACIDAYAARAAEATGEAAFEPAPEQCAQVPEGELMDAYMDGLQQANADGRDNLQDLIDEASEEAGQP